MMWIALVATIKGQRRCLRNVSSTQPRKKLDAIWTA